jgi:hypothetical protein
LPIGYIAITNLDLTKAKKSESPSTVGTIAIMVELLVVVSFSACDMGLRVLMEAPRLATVTFQKSFV